MHNASVPDPVKNVEMVDSRGNPTGEFDEISLPSKTLLEDKRGSLIGFEKQAARNKTTVEVEIEKWAEEQIFNKTVGRITSLAIAVGTRPAEKKTTDARPVPCIDEFRAFRILIFRLKETDSRVRDGIVKQKDRLSEMFPDWTFQLA